MSDDFSDKIKKAKSSERVQTRSLTRRVPRSKAETVTAKSDDRTPASMKAGQYERQTITLPPQQKRHIKALAKENGVGLLSFYRWLLDLALTAYDEGERPQPDEPIYRDVKVEHWSSK